MKAWLGTILLVVTSSFAVAAGCGSPQVVNQNGDVNGSGASAGSGGTGTGTGASGGTLSFGDGGDSTGSCPSSCAELNANCGFVTDTKCGGVVQCGTCSTAGEVCGGQEANRCGKGNTTTPTDGGTCTASSCTDLGAECGSVSDPACPGTVVDCGNTKCPGMCTGGKCSTTSCTPKGDAATLCAQAGLQCGTTSDGCDGTVDCGSCAAGTEACTAGVCVPVGCTVDPATTCKGKGYSCGSVGNNCGVEEVCGPSACSTPGWTCGGGSDSSGNPIPGVCGCTGACSQIPTCDPGTTTTLTGKVFDPAGRNPLYHVLVYIANNPSDPNLKSFPAGITCDVCGATAAGSPLVSTPGQTDPPAGEYSGVDGSFTLKNVPTGNVTLVIQLGRWRRTFPITVAKSCQANSVPNLLMPSTQAQGNIPLMAMVTGKADSLECVLRKIGIDASEFTNPSGTGRVQFYLGDTAPGQSIDGAIADGGNTPPQSQLFANNAINNYDMTILACQGGEYDESTNQTALRKYADAGGRVFATHYEYTWLRHNDGNPSNLTDPTADNWSQVAQWHVDENDRSATDDASSPITGIIDKISNPKGNAFQAWLEAVGASVPNSGTTTVYVVRHDTDFISPVAGRTQQWLYRNGDKTAGKCAVTQAACNGSGTAGGTCAAKVCTIATSKACTTNTDCTPMVCSNNPTNSCTQNSDCGGNGKCRANTCADNSCSGTDYSSEETPLHFTFNTPVNLVQNLNTTPPAVQCGRVLFSDFHVDNASENSTQKYPSQCALNVSRSPTNTKGTCSTDANCTGTCSGGLCPWGSACTKNADCASTCSGGVCLDPMTAQEKLLEYMIFDLGSCVPTTTCTPKTTCPAGQDCGFAPDGCGGLVACGTCPTGTQCGVPTANKCGTISCTPKACPSGQECGFASDGCSGSVNCGTCPSGQSCNDGKCSTTVCTPKSCTDQGIECGQAGDDCGNVISCPTCPAGDSCIAGKCVPLTCTPKTCKDQGIACGQAADGCGNLITDCGDCPSGDLCVTGQCVHVN